MCFHWFGENNKRTTKFFWSRDARRSLHLHFTLFFSHFVCSTPISKWPNEISSSNGLVDVCREHIFGRNVKQKANWSIIYYSIVFVALYFYCFRRSEKNNFIWFVCYIFFSNDLLRPIVIFVSAFVCRECDVHLVVNEGLPCISFLAVCAALNFNYHRNWINFSFHF